MKVESNFLTVIWKVFFYIDYSFPCLLWENLTWLEAMNVIFEFSVPQNIRNSLNIEYNFQFIEFCKPVKHCHSTTIKERKFNKIPNEIK